MFAASRSSSLVPKESFAPRTPYARHRVAPAPNLGRRPIALRSRGRSNALAAACLPSGAGENTSAIFGSKHAGEPARTPPLPAPRGRLKYSLPLLAQTARADLCARSVLPAPRGRRMRSRHFGSSGAGESALQPPWLPAPGASEPMLLATSGCNRTGEPPRQFPEASSSGPASTSLPSLAQGAGASHRVRRHAASSPVPASASQLPSLAQTSRASHRARSSCPPPPGRWAHTHASFACGNLGTFPRAPQLLISSC